MTDANLVLGRLNPEHLLGGELKLDRELAEKALREHVAQPMKTSVSGAAVGVLRVAVANMARALTAASVERGHDPRDMALVASGGAGPMHACEIAMQTEIPSVIVPPGAGLLSGLGLLLSEPMHDFVRTMLGPADKANLSSIESGFRSMERKGRALLRAERVRESAMVFERFFDMRYRGQAYELSVRIPEKTIDRGLVQEAVRSFHSLHRERYGYSDSEIEVEIVNLRVYCKGRVRPFELKAQSHLAGRVSQVTRRRVFLDGKFVDDCRVFDRREMGPGLRGKGPCVVEDYDSTLIVPSGCSYKVDREGSFRIAVLS